jgi:hypothetical protein
VAEDIIDQNSGEGAASAAPESEYRREDKDRGVYTKVQRRGVELSCSAEVEPTGGGVWSVGNAVVQFERKQCNCDSYKFSRPRTRCGHWWAVAYTADPPTPDEFVLPEIQQLEPVVAPASSIVVASKIPTEEEIARIARERVHGGYKRNVKAYDEHLRTEYLELMFMLKHLLPSIGPVLDVREQKKRGPKITPLADLLFGALMHAHHNWSFRRTEGMLALYAHPSIALTSPDYPRADFLYKFVRSYETTHVLRDLLALTAEPFRMFGKMTVATDGTGASTNRFDDWMVEGKHGIENREHRGWRKAHVACDVDTLAIVACYVTDKDVSEKRIILNNIIPELWERDYDIETMLLDGGYNATEIRDVIIGKLKATPYIPWAGNSKRAVSRKWRNKIENAALIEEIYHKFKTDEGKAFKEIYRYRVKVELLFSSIKTRFGGSVRALEGAGPENEILLKCICHNLHMLLLAAKVYGLDITSIGGPQAA